MKKYLLILVVLLSSITIANAQEVIDLPQQAPGTNRVYAELLGAGTNFFGMNKNVKVTVDLGQYQSATKSYTLQDENGKDIKFNSMVAAMNYMGERGWRFIQTYVVTVGKENVYHWLMFKDVTDSSQIREGLHIKNDE